MTTDERIINIMADTLGVEVEEVTPDARLDDLGVDSLSAVEVGMALEDEFQIDDIPIEELDKAKTVGDVLVYVRGVVDAKE